MSGYIATMQIGGALGKPISSQKSARAANQASHVKFCKEIRIAYLLLIGAPAISSLEYTCFARDLPSALTIPRPSWYLTKSISWPRLRWGPISAYVLRSTKFEISSTTM